MKRTYKDRKTVNAVIRSLEVMGEVEGVGLKKRFI